MQRKKEFTCNQGAEQLNKKLSSFSTNVPHHRGANYIEANDSLSKKDFLMRIKICRKEAKECRYWIQLIDIGEDSQVQQSREQLHQEATELMNIFGAILRKSETKNQN